MPMYIFTYNQKDNSFPDRYRVISPTDDAQALCQAESLSGTVMKDEAMPLLDKLTDSNADQPTILTEMVDAPHWQFIEHRFNPAKAAENANKPKTV